MQARAATVRGLVRVAHCSIDQPARHGDPVGGSSADFRGGKTQTTLRKLQAVGVPAYDGSVDLAPLAELAGEMERVREGIARTDRVIDRVVYGLYALTEEEKAVVEGRR